MSHLFLQVQYLPENVNASENLLAYNEESTRAVDNVKNQIPDALVSHIDYYY